MNRSIFSNFPWSLVAVLVGINLIRPLLSIAGLFDELRPIDPRSNWRLPVWPGAN